MCEEEIKKVTASVFKYILPDTWSEEKKEANPITAEEIVEAIKDGKDVEIKNAVITGPFILKSVNVEGVVTIQRTKIRDKIDWSYATFKRALNLGNSIFETDATFIAVTVEKDIFLDGATFCGKAKFSDITVMGVFYNQSTTFKKEVIFNDGLFKKGIKFSKCIFEGDTDFESARIGGNTEFIGAEFKQLVSFIQVQIEGAAFFNPATFVGEADFAYARIGSVAMFTKAEFKGDVDFAYARIGGNAKFTGAEFKQQASFNGAQIEESAFFNPAYLFSIAVECKDDLNKGIISEKLKNIFKTEGFPISQNSMVTKDKGDNWVITDGGKNYIVKKEDGKLNIYNPATFEGEANFVSARIGSIAHFAGAEFKQRASFNGAQIEGAAFFNPATFVGEANFVSARIGGNAEFPGAVFKKQASFNGAQIEGAAFFKSATFVGEANFVSARIGSTADFTGAEFKKQAIFNRAQIEGAAFFNPATFEGEANFVSARIGSTADFNGAEFKERASFNRAQIEESAFFKSATFVGEANFVSARIGSNAEFNGAEFKQRASFNGAQIEGAAFFKSATFVGEANFVSARIGSTADFNGAEFKERASFNRAQIEESAFFNPATFEGEANFVSARIGSTADFNGAEFKQQAYFDSAQIERESHFEGTVFANDVCFQDTTLKTVFWGEPNVRFIKNIDLRGCIYDRIHPISFWQQLMEHLGPYDRQPFTQLEETFRRAGKDKLADDVYYMRKCRESAQKTIRKPSAWVLDRFLWLLTGYGVRLYRLLLAIVPILIIGTLIFHLEGAVKLDIQLPSMMSSQATLPWCDAFWVSLNTFLPIEIPSGADWKPSSQIIPVWGIKFTTFATLLNLAGWILVPVGVAGIAGLLKRSK